MFLFKCESSLRKYHFKLAPHRRIELLSSVRQTAIIAIIRMGQNWLLLEELNFSQTVISRTHYHYAKEQKLVRVEGLEPSPQDSKSWMQPVTPHSENWSCNQDLNLIFLTYCVSAFYLLYDTRLKLLVDPQRIEL